MLLLYFIILSYTKRRRWGKQDIQTDGQNVNKKKPQTRGHIYLYKNKQTRDDKI